VRPALVGRGAEQRAIETLVAGARLGRSGVLVLTGEAGIGKTALLEHAAVAAEGVQVLRATGSEAEREVPFGGLAQLLRPTSADLDRIPAPQAQALGVALALRSGPVVDRLAIGAAVLSLLTRYSEDRPLGVLVDDAHHLDRPSGEALAFACRRLLADPVFVVIASRPDPRGALTTAGLPELAVGGLSPAATGALARADGRRPTARALAELHRVTGGNPLAVLELARDPGRLLFTAPGAPTPVPAALITWFGERAAALGADARTVLLLIATAGADLAVVTRACSALGVDVRALADGERAGLIEVRTDRVDFVHPLVRASVYGIASPAERRALHAVVAGVLPAADADRRAWHRCEATLGLDDVIATELVAVAQRASGRGAHAVSATAYERAARLSTDDGDRARRLLQAAHAAWRAGDGDAAVPLLTRALALDPSSRNRAEALGLHGDIAAHRGAPGEAQGLFAAAADEVAAEDPSRAVILRAEAVSASFFHGDVAAALAAAEGAERLLGRDLTPTAAALGTLASGMARILAGHPGTDRIRAGVDLLTAIADPAAARMRPAWLMFGVLWLRESGAGRALVRTALEESRSRSAVGDVPTLLFTIARDGATTDRWAAAEADYSEAIALARELGQTTVLAISLAGLAWLEARLGRAPECRAHAEEALAVCAVHPVNTARAWAEFALGELALATGDVAGAVERLSGLEVLLTGMGLHDPDLSPAPELAEALLRCGRDDEGRAVAAGHRARAEAKGLPWAAARAARLRGLFCAPGDVDECFAAALDLHARTPDLFEEARTRLLHGARLRRSRRRADARVPLRAALQVFQRLGARPWAELAASELAATGETVPAGDPTDLGRLTPRELQIALLLAEGRTTRETAAALFLSPKTVEYHLRHVYTKLGIASRAELVARIDPAR